MKKTLMIFGSEGALGKGVTSVLTGKDYDEIYLFDFRFESKTNDSRIRQIITGDLSVEENAENAIGQVSVNDKSLYFLFSTVGGFYGGKTAWNTGEEDFDKMINMNLKANFFIAKYFAALVKKSVGGSLCLTSAYTAEHAEAEKAIYGASKAALSHLIRSISAEGKDIKMSANAIAPYIIDTPANRKFMPDSDSSGWMKPEEIGELVNSLFSHFNFISGNIIELKHKFEV